MDRKLVFINGEKNEAGGSVQIVGGLTGSGKTTYLIKEIAKAVKNNESVLAFPMEHDYRDFVEAFSRALSPGVYDTSKSDNEISTEIEKANELISNADLIIQYGLTSDEAIIEKIKEYGSQKNSGLIVIDHLGFPLSQFNSEEGLLKFAEKFNPGLGCRVLISTQIARRNLR